MLVLPKNCAKILRDLTFFSDFEQLLSNFLRNYGNVFGKSQATCEKPYLGGCSKRKI